VPARDACHQIAGIADPVKAVRIPLDDAVSVAGIVLLTEATAAADVGV
jgi:chaperonin GroEL (HSP60 family)